MIHNLHCLLTVAAMAAADARTIAAGTPGVVLMERAGRAVARAALRRCGRAKVVVLAGPGNNGGDGLVAARLLREQGWQVALVLLGERAGLSGDAAVMAARWPGSVLRPGEARFDDADMVIDALFGAGLARPLQGEAADLIAAANACPAYKIAVDLPSGVVGDSGAVLGTAFKADCTVTFARKKPGHLLFPGRDYCGEVGVADIGITDATIAAFGNRLAENHPDCWRDEIPPRPTDGHKYQHGHLLVVGGPRWQGGAARLAAYAGLRAGAGLVTIAAARAACDIYAAKLDAVMLAGIDDPAQLLEFAGNRRVSAFVVGPGNRVDERCREYSLALLGTGKPVLLDADALTAFADRPQRLFDAITGIAVLTPHDGEFRRLFPDLGPEIAKPERAGIAARRSGAIVVLKGADTVIAAPDGRVLINANASPWLATAGSGDVLSGVIGGLLARGTPGFAAAAAGVWLHGAVGAIGEGMIAEDMVGAIPVALMSLRR